MTVATTPSAAEVVDEIKAFNGDYADTVESLDEALSDIADKDEELSEQAAEIEQLLNEKEALDVKLNDAISGKSSDNSDARSSDSSSKSIDEVDGVSKDAELVTTSTKSLGTFSATHYTAYCEGCSGVTYKGHDLRKSLYTAEGHRVIAVDPSVIPLGSVVKVTYSNGTTFTAQALDIGGAIKGRIIDIAVESKEEARKLGRVSVTVEVIK